MIGAMLLAVTTIYGPGIKSCGTWTAEHRNLSSAVSLYQDTWLIGYVSGVNDWRLSKVEANAQSDSDGMIGWVTNYCSDHPLDQISDAAAKLIVELRKAK